MCGLLDFGKQIDERDDELFFSKLSSLKVHERIFYSKTACIQGIFKKSVEAEAKNAIRFMRELSKKDTQY